MHVTRAIELTALWNSFAHRLRHTSIRIASAIPLEWLTGPAMGILLNCIGKQAL
jgi:hypothetical protein